MQKYLINEYKKLSREQFKDFNLKSKIIKSKKYRKKLKYKEDYLEEYENYKKDFFI